MNRKLLSGIALGLTMSSAVGLAQDNLTRNLLIRGTNTVPANVGTLTVTALTAPRTYTFPNYSGPILVANAPIQPNAAVRTNAASEIETITLTNGQILIGSTGLTPQVGTITGTANQVIVTNGAGSITLSLPQDIHTAATPTFGGMTLNGNLDITAGGATILGTTTINASGAATTSIGNTSGGSVTVSVNSGTTNLVLQGILNNDATTTFLTLDGTNVRNRTLASFLLANNGVTYNDGGDGAFRLGGNDNADAPFTENRFVNLNASNLNFTANAGALTPLQIVGGAAPVVNVVGTTNINSGAIGTTSIGFAGGTNNITGSTTLLGATDINVTGSALTRVGNATSTVTIQGGTNNIVGTANINTGAIATTSIGIAGGTNNITGSTTLLGATDINVTGTSATNIGHVAGGTVTVGVNSGTTNLVLNGIEVVAPIEDILWITNTNQVRRSPFAGTAAEGVEFQSSAYRLGGQNNTTNPLTSTRFVNVDGQLLNFTVAGGANNLVQISGTTQTVGVGNAANANYTLSSTRTVTGGAVQGALLGTAVNNSASATAAVGVTGRATTDGSYAYGVDGSAIYNGAYAGGLDVTRAMSGVIGEASNGGANVTALGGQFSALTAAADALNVGSMNYANGSTGGINVGVIASGGVDVATLAGSVAALNTAYDNIGAYVRAAGTNSMGLVLASNARGVHITTPPGLPNPAITIDNDGAPANDLRFFQNDITNDASWRARSGATLQFVGDAGIILNTLNGADVTLGQNVIGSDINLNSISVNAPNLTPGADGDNLVTIAGGALRNTPVATALATSAWLIGGNTLVGASVTRIIGIATQAADDDALAIQTDGTNRLLFSGTAALATASVDLVPNADNARDLGSDALRWQDLYLNGTSLHIGPTGGEAANTELQIGYAGTTTGFLRVNGAATPQVEILASQFRSNVSAHVTATMGVGVVPSTANRLAIEAVDGQNGASILSTNARALYVSSETAPTTIVVNSNLLNTDDMTISESAIARASGALSVSAPTLDLSGSTVVNVGFGSTVNINATPLSSSGPVNINTLAGVHTTTIGHNTALNTTSINSPVVNAPNLPAGVSGDNFVTINGGALRSSSVATALGTTAWLIGGNTLVGANATRVIGIATQATDEDALAIQTDGTNRLLFSGTAALATASVDFVPNADNARDLGSDAVRWRNLFLNGTSLHIGPTGGLAANTEFALGYATNTASFNVDGGASELSITPATTTIANALAANGNTTIGASSTQRLTVNSHILGGSPLVFQGATDDAFETTFGITDPTADRTITFPDASGTVALTGNVVAYGPSAPQNTIATGGTRLLDVAYDAAVSGTPLGARISATAVDVNTGATALTVSATATGSGVATALDVTAGNVVMNDNVTIGATNTDLATVNARTLFNAGVRLSNVVSAANVDVDDSHHVIIMTAAATNVNLPPVPGAGRVLIIKNASGGVVNVNPDGAHNIEGLAVGVGYVQPAGTSMTIIFNGTTWYQIGN